jgi:hypothetical protein
VLSRATEVSWAAPIRQGLAARYGHPVTALNLVKAAEKRPRESILRTEFASAVRYLNCTVRGSAAGGFGPRTHPLHPLFWHEFLLSRSGVCRISHR